MRKGRFSEERIINVLKEHQAGIPGRRVVPQARDQRRDLNGRFRDECLNEHVFHRLPMARRIIEA